MQAFSVQPSEGGEASNLYEGGVSSSPPPPSPPLRNPRTPAPPCTSTAAHYLSRASGVHWVFWSTSRSFGPLPGQLFDTTSEDLTPAATPCS